MIRVRPGIPEDSAAVARIQVETWRTAYAGILPQEFLDGMDVARSEAFWRSEILKGGADRFLLVSEAEGECRGFLTGGPLRVPVPGFTGEIYAFYVLKAHQRRGAGSALFTEGLRTLALLGMPTAVAWTLKENPCAGFYTKAGGTPIGTKAFMLQGNGYPEIGFGWG